VTEFNGDEFSGIRVDHVAGLHHLALLHEELDEVDRTLGHALCKFLQRDRLGDDHLAGNLLARLVDHRALELLLTAAHRRQRAAAALVARQGGGQRQLAATAIAFRLLYGLRRSFRLDGTALDSGGTATALVLIIVIHDNRLGGSRHLRLLLGRSTALGLFLGAALGLGLGGKPCLFLGLAACGFFLLLAAALFFLGAARGFLGSALALLDLTQT